MSIDPSLAQRLRFFPASTGNTNLGKMPIVVEIQADEVRYALRRNPMRAEIVGEILYEIRRSRFVIAEVTGQNQGVYFEAGYAMGHMIPVIWVCRKIDFDHVHFDTKQYSHVIWENEADLVEKLTDRIKGTIL